MSHSGTNSQLFHFLSSILRRFSASFRGAAFTLQTWCTSLWRSILLATRATQWPTRRFGHPKIQLYPSDAPDTDIIVGRPQNVSDDEVERESKGNSRPGESRWKDKLETYQDLFSEHRFPFIRFPATPEKASRRYWQRRFDRKSNSLISIQPGQWELLTALSIPEGWGRHVHPEGNVLFYHHEMRISTESDIYNSDTRNKLIFVATALIHLAIKKQDSISLDEFTELVLNVHDQRWCYYFVDHSTHLLFWVDSVTMNQLGNSLQGVTEHSHISGIWSSRFTGMLFLAVSQYGAHDLDSRMHCEYYPYPHGHTLPKGIVEDLRGMLNHAKTDMMTGHSPSSPFAKDELISISDLVNSLKEDEMNGNPYTVWVIARLMSYFTDNQFVNFCAQPTVRLNADTSLFEPQTWDCRFLFRAISVFLFLSPNEHAHRLHRVWVDSMIIQPRWKEFVDRLTTEWGRYTIFSTVMLAVDFSFLAVPGVVIPGHDTTAIQVIIYCSIVATIASIVFSFTLLNAYSNPGLTRAVPAGKAMYVLSRIRSGMACLAITHSLPMASLTWSIALFSTALAIQLFGPKERATVVTLGIECLVIALLIIMCFSVTGMLYRIGDSQSEGDDTDSSTDKTTVLAEPMSDV